VPIEAEWEDGVLKRMRYDPGTLELEFPGGRVYRYAGVPPEVAQEFLEAEDEAIMVFNELVRNRYVGVAVV
jgi:hypothetical protein